MLNSNEPPGIVREVTPPRHQAMREQAQALAVTAAKDSLELGWVLGEIKSSEAYKSWLTPAGLPYASFLAWISVEITPYIGKSMAYELATIGIFMKAARPQVEQALADKKIGIMRLAALASLIERNKASLVDVVDAIESGKVLDAEHRGEPDPEQFVKLPITIPRGDATVVRKGLLYHAVRNGHATLDQAVMDLAISEAQNVELPAFAERWLDLIEQDAFYCANCGRIPRQPTEHHLIPQSIAQGEGPTCLLDWECHKLIQPKWVAFGEQYMKSKRRFHDLIAKYKQRGADPATVTTCGCDGCATEPAT